MTLADVALAAWWAPPGPSWNKRMTRSTRVLGTRMRSRSRSSVRLRTMTASCSEVSLINCAKHLRRPLKSASLWAEGVLHSLIHCRNCLSSGSADCDVANSSLMGIWKSLTRIPSRKIGKSMREAATSRWLKHLSGRVSQRKDLVWRSSATSSR